MARRTTSLGARVGARVKHERAQQSMTRLGLSRSAGLSIAYLQQLENGNVKNPTMDTLEKLSGALGVGVDELSAGPPSGLEADLAEARRRLDEVVRRARETLPPVEAAAVVASIEAHLAALRGES